MYFIGVDLGWKDKKTTGICVLDESLEIKSSRVVQGSKLLTSLKPYLSKTSIIAIDAPHRESFTKIWRRKNRLHYRLLLSNLKV